MSNDDNLAKTIRSSRLAGLGGTELSKTLGAISGVAAPGTAAKPWSATAKKTTAEINDVFIMLIQLHTGVTSLRSVTKGCRYI
jgi:hypothetical protein